MTKLRDYHEFSDKIETFCGRPQVAPTNKFENQQFDKRELEASDWMQEVQVSVKREKNLKIYANKGYFLLLRIDEIGGKCYN